MPNKQIEKLVKGYEDYIERKGIDEKAVDAYFQACQAAYLSEKDIEYGLQLIKRYKELNGQLIQKATNGGNFKKLEIWSQKNKQPVKLIDQMYELLKLESFYDFESYMLYMEKDRPFDKRFYMPRRGTLQIVAKDLMRLENDELDTYGLSMPSRTGKSTICIMFLSWVGLRKPMSHNAMGGHSGQLVKRFYRGLDNVVSLEDYKYAELFNFFQPDYKKVVERKSTDPAELSINLGKADEFPTYVCRGIDATWTGAIDISEDGYLYVDDLVRDREHSLSQTRMENTYQEYQNKMLDRMNDGAKKLLVGTLWSVLDPLVREEHENKDNPRAFFRKIPALNENDESNYQYDVKGFSSQYYINMRNRLDTAEWMAKFQQKPFVREGLTFPIESLHRFDGYIPEGTHRTYAAVDPAFGRGDSLSMPICKDFGEKKYIIDWVHDKRSLEFTIPLIVDKIQEHMITKLRVEKNRGGDLVAEKIQDEMDKRNVRHCALIVENTSNKMAKEEKISAYSGYIKKNFYFLENKKWSIDCVEDYFASDQYKRAMDELVMFSAEGKNNWDDAPDSLTQLALMFDTQNTIHETRIFSSPI